MKRVLSSAVMFALLFSFISIISFGTAFAEEDTVAPEIDLSSLYFDTKEIQYGEYNKLYARITDQSVLKPTIIITNRKNTAITSSNGGLCSTIIQGDQYGRYQLEAILLEDSYENRAAYVDPRYEEKNSLQLQNYEIRYADFSNLYFDVVSDEPVEEDTTAPELDLSDMYFASKEIAYGEYNKIYARITDQSVLKPTIIITNRKNTAITSSNGGLCSTIIQGDQYGRYQLEAILLEDSYENRAAYVDPRYEEKNSFQLQNYEIRYADFSNLYFDVVSEVTSNSIILPNGLKTINSEAFINLPNIKRVFIPSSVTDIADDAFDEGIEIQAPSGSFAQQWANEHGYAYSAHE